MAAPIIPDPVETSHSLRMIVTWFRFGVDGVFNKHSWLLFYLKVGVA
jgi:hypothetical protein